MIPLVLAALGLSLAEFQSFSQLGANSPAPVRLAWKISAAITTLFTFLISSLVYLYLAENKQNIRSLMAIRSLKIKDILLASVLIVSCFSINMQLVAWTYAIPLPDTWYEFIRAHEEDALQLTQGLLHIESFGDALFVLLVVSVLAGIGEELFFRGILQNQLCQMTKNIHLGVFISAAFFSLIHLQFYGFFARLFLGLVLGYLYVYSQSLWLPIIAHALNNALGGWGYYLEQQSILPSASLTEAPPLAITLVAVGVFTIISYLFLKNCPPALQRR